MRILIAICLFVSSSTVGVFVAKRYREREMFFADYLDFLQHAKAEIGFFQNRLVHVLSSFEPSGFEFKDFLQRKIAQIETGKIVERPKILTENEWQIVDGFVSKIGRANAETECDNISAMIDRITIEKKKASDLCKTKGRAATKLGFALGAALAIVVF